MSSALEKGMSVISYLSARPEGAAVKDIAAALDLPPSGAHRLLKELEALGYVHQPRAHGDYCLTLKLATAGLNFLARTGIPDLSQPILDRLAQKSRELVRMTLSDGEILAWVGVSQGATSGLRYDPNAEHGQIVHFASASSGQAWLSGMTDDEAIAAVMKQGLENPNGSGAKAPQSVAELVEIVKAARRNGYALNSNSFMLGMAAISVLIRNPDTGTPIGTVSIAGPAARVTPERLRDFLPDLRQAAEELGDASRAKANFSSWYNANLVRKQA